MKSVFYVIIHFLLALPAKLLFLLRVKGRKNEPKRAKMKYDEKGWAELCRSMEELILGEVERMRSGEISASPIKRKSDSGHPCDYCSYKFICRSFKE